MPLTTFVSAGRRVLPNHWDLIAFAAIMAVLTAVAELPRHYRAAARAERAPVSLDYWKLPYYALRTALRMFAALAASLVFTFTYATLAAKSRRAEMVLIPVLDILQSVPILGFLSFTVTFFLGLFPGNVLGAECAAIFAIFTSQAWNMAFSFYQSLRTVPRDLDEVARGFRLTGWQKFWQLEAPFAMPGLIWNTMMSMSGGWFFVVASEAITVGDTTITLPGVGSYIAKANNEGDWARSSPPSLTMAIVILLYDQLLFRPIVAWAAKFRVELSSRARSRALLGARAAQAHPLAADWAFSRSSPHCALQLPADRLPRFAPDERHGASARPVAHHRRALDPRHRRRARSGRLVERLLCRHGIELGRRGPSLRPDLLHLAARRRADGAGDGGLGADQRLDRPEAALGRSVQPIAQFLAAFPVNLLFGAAVSLVLAFNLNPDIWLSLLIVFGTQWYIVFNTIAGAAAFPNDLREAAANFRVHGWHWWTQVILPGVAALLPHRRDHRLGRLVERLDRRRIRQMEGPDASSPTASAPISPRRPTRATFRRSCSASR